MKTVIQQAIKEIAELWSSPSDQPTYSQIFDVLDRMEEKEKQQIMDDYEAGRADCITSERYYKEAYG